VCVCVCVCVRAWQRPITKRQWYETVEWGQVAFFMLLAPAVIVISSKVQTELLKQLNVKR
jgi:hypothetical protein